MLLAAENVIILGEKAFVPADKVFIPADKVLLLADKVLVPANNVFIPADKVLVPADKVLEMMVQNVTSKQYFIGHIHLIYIIYLKMPNIYIHTVCFFISICSFDQIKIILKYYKIS